MNTQNTWRMGLALALTIGTSAIPAVAAESAPKARPVEIQKSGPASVTVLTPHLPAASAAPTRLYPHVGPYQNHMGPGLGSVKSPPFHHRRALTPPQDNPQAERQPSPSRLGPGIGSPKAPFNNPS